MFSCGSAAESSPFGRMLTAGLGLFGRRCSPLPQLSERKLHWWQRADQRANRSLSTFTIQLQFCVDLRKIMDLSVPFSCQIESA